MNEISSKQYSKDEVDRIISQCKKIWSARIALPYPSPKKAEPNNCIAISSDNSLVSALAGNGILGQNSEPVLLFK